MELKDNCFICSKCIHYCENTNFETMGGCRAFPQGIPDDIGSPHTHDTIVKGQMGEYIYENNIPIPVRALFSEEYRIYLLGVKDGLSYYYAYIPDEKTGFPNVVAYGENVLEDYDGFMALDIAAQFQH